MLNIVVMQNIDNRKQLIFDIIRDDFFCGKEEIKVQKRKLKTMIMLSIGVGRILYKKYMF